jgi:hypothetical protein
LLHPPPASYAANPTYSSHAGEHTRSALPCSAHPAGEHAGRGPPCSRPVPPRGGARPGQSSLRPDARPCGGGAPLQLGAWARGHPPPRKACGVHCRAPCGRGRGSSRDGCSELQVMLR